MRYIEIYCRIGGSKWLINRSAQPDINAAHRLLAESISTARDYCVMLIEEGADFSALPIPKGKP